MMIQVTHFNKQNALGNEYTYVEMLCDNQSVLVVVCKGEYGYVQVIVQNATNRAWRGMGKKFATVSDAIANYKKEAIRTMIEHAAELAA